MEAIPFALLLAPFILVAAIASLFLFFNLYHLWQYGIESSGTKLLMTAYIALFLLTLVGTWSALSGFDWQGTFSLMDLLPSGFGASSLNL